MNANEFRAILRAHNSDIRLAYGFTSITEIAYFRCAKAHRFKAAPESVLAGNGCYRCIAHKRAMEQAVKLKKLREFKAIITALLAANRKYLASPAIKSPFRLLREHNDNILVPENLINRCAMGHQWMISRTTKNPRPFCPACGGKALPPFEWPEYRPMKKK